MKGGFAAALKAVESVVLKAAMSVSEMVVWMVALMGILLVDQ